MVVDEREEVLEANMGLVRSIAHRYASHYCIPESMEDLCQEAKLGLLDAYSKFDPEKGKFSTYATHYITGAIEHYLRDRALTIKVPEGEKYVTVYSIDQKPEHVAEVADEFDIKSVISGVDINDAFMCLDSDEKYAIIAYFYYEKSQKEIAIQLKTLQPLVSRMIRKALKKLRPVFAEQQECMA